MDIYILSGEFPEALMLGGTSVIGQLYQHVLYYWNMFRDNPIQYYD